MKKSTKILLSSIAASILLIGCGGGGGSSSSTTTTTGTVSGTATDGYIAGAQACLDLNFNTLCDSNEPKITTDANGKFSIKYSLNEPNASIAPVIVIGGTDTSTGETISVPLIAPRAGENSIVVSPLTTVAAEAIYQVIEENNNTGISKEQIRQITQTISQKLGVSDLYVNPLEANNSVKVKAFAIAAMIKQNADINITKLVEDENATFEDVLPANYQAVYTTVVNTIDENVTLPEDALQTIVQSCIIKQDTSDLNETIQIYESNLSEENKTLELEKLVVKSQLDIIYKDLNESGLLTYNSNGLEYDITDMNSSYVAENLVTEYNITDAKTLMEEYKNIGDINISANNETNLTAVIEVYNTLQSVKAFKNRIDFKLANIDLANKMIFRASMDGSPIYLNENGTFTDYKFSEEEGGFVYVEGGRWIELENVLVLNKMDHSLLLGIEATNETLMPVFEVDSENNTFNDNVIISILTPDTNITSSPAISKSILNQRLEDFNASDINGSIFVTNDGTKIAFDSNGSCEINGHDIGNWEVDGYGAIIMPYKNGGKVYVLKGQDINNYSTEAYFAFVDSNNHIMSIQKSKLEVWNSDSVALAKNIFSSLRTQIDSIANANNSGTLDIEADKFKEQLKDIAFDNVESAGNTLAYIIDAIAKNEVNGSVELDNSDLNRTFTLSTDDNKTFSYIVKDDLNGTIKKYNGTITLNGEIPEDLTQSFDITLNVVGQLPASNEEEISQNINTSIELKYDADDYIFNLTIGKINLTDKEKSVELSDINIIMAGTENLEEIKYIKLNSFNISGKAGDFEADGSVNVKYVQNPLIKNESNDQAFKYYYTLTGYFVCMDENGNIDWAMTLPQELNITVDDEIYQLPVNPSEAQIEGYPWYNIFVTIPTSAEIDEDEWYFSIEQAVENQVQCNDANYTAHIYDNYGPTLWIDEDEDFLNDGWLPNSITFNGSISDTETNNTLIGSITATSSNIGSFDPDKDYISSAIELTVKLIRQDFADTNVNSKFTSSADGSTTLDFSYNVEGTTFGTITLSGKWDKDGTGEVSVTSTTGLKVEIPVVNGDIDYSKPIPVYVKEEVVGYIEQRDGIPVIKYNDGTFESIN